MEDEADNYIFGTQEQQQDIIAEELQNAIREGITLGIKFDDMGDYELCAPFLDKGAAVYSSERLLNGITTQKLEFERHRLFKNHSKCNCSEEK
ncbi:hypothetical protein RHMOL_Rhmol11G0019100 [Rhododendron molle]|uniref:Uncharacterized protein n=1 Tax=Rhododendron molle TaxID=49168 RepID=A0ACC0LMR6_RHOML|nr:hypothetical protein RHMOL_Rhmol11G0019100 [Rhododendron molle]